MRKPRTVTGKIVLGMEGLGVPDGDLWQQRAWEVARIQGREEPNALDWEEASRELHGMGVSGESVTGGAERLEATGVGGEGLGYGEAGDLREVTLSGSVEMERSTGEELVREGLEEAEHERMLLGQSEGLEREGEPLEE
jgi:hypothetical protein